MRARFDAGSHTDNARVSADVFTLRFVDIIISLFDHFDIFFRYFTSFRAHYIAVIAPGRSAVHARCRFFRSPIVIHYY